MSAKPAPAKAVQPTANGTTEAVAAFEPRQIIADDLEIANRLIAMARKSGADAADVVILRGQSVSAELRLGQPEKMERSEGIDLGLRVFIGQRQASVSSSDLGTDALSAVVERCTAMARAVPEDEYCGIAAPSEIAASWPELDMYDATEPAAEALLDLARATEEAALAVPGVNNSGGAEGSWGRSTVVLCASNGFAGGYATSRFGVGVSVMAGEGTGMERDYEFSSAIYRSDLDDAGGVGRAAGERAVRKLGPRKVKTMKVPVVFDPRVSNGILGHLSGAISGAAIARGTSFLKDRLGQPVMPKGFTVVDDPHRQRGLRSKPFDGEGLANRRRNLVEDGVLQGWVLDLRSGRQLGLTSSGNASRGTSGPPGPATTNLYLEPGSITPAALLAEIGTGLYVTELMGFGVNGVTGDYSRGASGFWIEGGTLAYPVSELTIAGNLKEMLMALTAADDLVFKYGMNAPTLRINEMTVAGG